MDKLPGSQKPLWPCTCRIPVLKRSLSPPLLHTTWAGKGGARCRSLSQVFKGVLPTGSMTDLEVYWCFEMRDAQSLHSEPSEIVVQDLNKRRHILSTFSFLK